MYPPGHPEDWTPEDWEFHARRAEAEIRGPRTVTEGQNPDEAEHRCPATTDLGPQQGIEQTAECIMWRGHPDHHDSGFARWHDE